MSTITARSNRRVPRRTFEGSVGVLVAGHYEIERALQVGEGGMMITTSRALGVGDRLVLSFSLYGGSTMIIVRATVRNFVAPKRSASNPLVSEPAHVGVEFANLEFQHKREIRNFVASATE